MTQPDPNQIIILTSSAAPPASVTLQSLSTQIDAQTSLINSLVQVIDSLVQENAALRTQIGSLQMAFSLSGPQSDPIIAFTTTGTLTRPTTNTVREVKPTANAVATLYAATGSGIVETFDVSALGGFTFGVALQVGDSYDANNAGVAAAIASLIAGGAASFRLRDVAANTWHLE